jgi:UDP-N-acetylglucosamine transferase subunit ALG13
MSAERDKREAPASGKKSARDQLEELITRRQEELGAQLEERGERIAEAAASALPKLGEQIWANLQERLRAEFEQRQTQLQQALEQARAETASLEERAERLVARVDTGLAPGFDPALAESVSHLREELARSRELNQRAQQSVADWGKQTWSFVKQRLEAAFDQHQQALAAQLDEVGKIRDHLQSLLRQAPETLDQHLSQGVGSVVEQVRSRVEEEVAAQSQSHREQLNQRQQELSAELEERGQQLVTAAASALPQLEEKLWINVEERLGAEFKRRQAELQQVLEAARAETTRLKAGAGADQAIADHVARTTEELQRLAAETRRQLSEESRKYGEARARLEARCEEVGTIRDHLESLLRQLPETLDQHLNKGVAAAMARLQTRVEAEIVAQTRSQAEQLNRQLAQLSTQAGEAPPPKVFQDLERRQAELLERAEKRLEEAGTVEGNIRTHAAKVFTELWDRLEEQFSRRQEELNAGLEKRSEQLAVATAASALPQLEEKLWNNVQERLRTESEQRQPGSPPATASEPRKEPEQEFSLPVPEPGRRRVRLYAWIAFLISAFVLGFALLPKGKLDTAPEAHAPPPAAENEGSAIEAPGAEAPATETSTTEVPTTEVPTTEPPATETPLQPRFSVQVGAYANRNAAEAVAQRFAATYQYQPQVTPVQVRDGVLYRVRLLTPTEGEANQLAERLGAEHGIEPLVTPLP